MFKELKEKIIFTSCSCASVTCSVESITSSLFSSSSKERRDRLNLTEKYIFLYFCSEFSICLHGWDWATLCLSSFDEVRKLKVVHIANPDKIMTALVTGFS